MKLNFTNSSFTKAIYCSLLASGVLVSHNLWATDDPEIAKKKKDDSGTTVKTSLNNRSVKIYPDAFRRDMHVIIKEKTEINFFVFDLEGTLMVNRKMKANEHFKITGLEKGVYSYHVFNGDEEKMSGKFEIR